jgi:hypothetical protein
MERRGSGADRYWIAIGLMDPEGDEARDRREDLDAVCRAIDDALQGEPAVTEIRWWGDQPFLGAGTAHPLGGSRS